MLRLFRNEVTITSDEIESFRPVSELDRFAAATETIIAGLDDKIADLDDEINRKIAQLSDLRRIHSAQCLALRHMQGEI